jgi:hypothetical protein
MGLGKIVQSFRLDGIGNLKSQTIPERFLRELKLKPTEIHMGEISARIGPFHVIRFFIFHNGRLKSNSPVIFAGKPVQLREAHADSPLAGRFGIIFD